MSVPPPDSQATLLPLKATQFCGNLVVAFRDVWKREVARGTSGRHADRDTLDRHAHPASGAPVWSTMEPTTTAADCAATGTVRPKTISAAASTIFMRRCEMYILASSQTVSRLLLRIVSETGRARRPCVALTSLIAVVLLLSAAPSDAQPAVRQVLVLQSFDRGNTSVDQFTTNFRVELDRLVEGPVNVVRGVVGPTGFVSAPEQAVVHYIRSAFVNRPNPDLIVTIAGPAAVSRASIASSSFPRRRYLFASVDQKYLRDAPLGDDETAVAVVNDFPRVIEDVLQLLPQTRQVVHGGGVRTSRPVLASRAGERVQAFSRPVDICLVRPNVRSGNPPPQCQPARELGNSVCHFLYGRPRGWRLQTNECSPSFTPRPTHRS